MRELDAITDSMDMSLSKLLGDSEGWGSLRCCSPWDCKESETTQQLSNNELSNNQLKIVCITVLPTSTQITNKGHYTSGLVSGEEMWGN